MLRTTSFVAQASSFSAPCNGKLRGKPSCDGGYARPIIIPCPAASKNCLKVSALARPSYPESNIYPGMRGVDTLPISPELWNSAVFNPFIVNANKEVIFEAGVLDAKYWMSQNGYYGVYDT